jgi:hypothetical protein
VHGTLQEDKGICSLRVLLTGVRTNSHHCAAGSKHRSKGMKCSMSPDHLLRKPEAIVQEFFELVRVYRECGHAKLPKEEVSGGRQPPLSNE